MQKPSGLKIDNLTFLYGQRTVLDDVSFAVARGDFCALLGPNGAGKTSLFSLLTGLLSTPTGRIEVGGIDIGTSPRAALATMGVVFQSPTLDLDLTVRRNLAYYAALRGMSGRDAARGIDASLERLGLTDKASVVVRELNGGHRRRTEIARALLNDPEVLLLDEPTVGLDPANRASIVEHVHALCRERGMTVLWATHLVDEVRADDDLVILHRGRVLAHDKSARLAGDRSVAEVFLDMTAQVA